MTWWQANKPRPLTVPDEVNIWRVIVVQWYKNREILLSAVLNSNEMLTFKTVRAVVDEVLGRHVRVEEYTNPENLIAEAKTLDRDE